MPSISHEMALFMKVVALDHEQMNRLVGEKHNPPVVRNQTEENKFQAEIAELYERLLDSLSPLGEEGDGYGVSDFAVRPDLTGGLNVRAAPHTREFTLTVLSERFFRTHYLEVLHRFLCTEATDYRIWIDHDFNPNWIQTVVLTCKVALIHGTKDEEASRLQKILIDV